MLSRYGVEPDVRKIAVLRVNGLGDFISAVPALEALRAAYPAAEIVLLAKDWHAAFLAGRPGPVNRVVVVPPAGGGVPTPLGPPPLVALHPGATDPRRWWPADKFAAVGDALAAAGAQVVVTGTQGEQQVVAAVVRAMTSEAQDLCAQLSLGGLAGLLSRCRVVVANDSGPLHLAASVGAATVGIYWCFNLINWGPPTRSRHRPSVSWRLTCPVCGIDHTQGRCDHRASFVADVPTEGVVASALDLFAAAS